MEDTESDEDDRDEGEDDIDNDDWSDVQDQNQLLVIDLVEKLGGCVQAVNGGTSIDGGYCVRTVLKKPNA